MNKANNIALQRQPQFAYTMHNVKYCLALFAATALLTTNAQAANTFRVDDSASQPIAAQAQLKWKNEAPKGPDANVAETEARINIKLNTQPWQTKNGRIYMALAPLRNGQLRAMWATQGRLQSGSLVSGGRGLVYQGRINSAMIEDIMTLRISVDGRLISSPENLQFYFEIELY